MDRSRDHHTAADDRSETDSHTDGIDLSDAKRLMQSGTCSPSKHAVKKLLDAFVTKKQVRKEADSEVGRLGETGGGPTDRACKGR
jgi:hypothetical protein